MIAWSRDCAPRRSRRRGRTRRARRTGSATGARCPYRSAATGRRRARTWSGWAGSSRRTRRRCPGGVVAVPVVPGPARRGHRDLLVEHAQRGLDVGVADRELAQPDQLLEPAVDDGALVQGGTAVAEVVADRRVRVTGLGQPDEVARGVRTGGGHRPGLDVPLEVVGGGLVEPGPGGVTVAGGNGRRGGQPGDLGRDRGRRVAGLLLPALDAVGRAVGDQEVRGRLDVALPQGGVTAEPGQVRHQDRIGGLVQLGAAGVRGGLAVEQRVARHRPVRQLLPVEQEPGRRPGRADVPVGQQPGERLVQVAGEHFTVGAEVRRLASGVHPRLHRLAPRAGQGRDDGAGERLVLARLQHVRRQVVRAAQVPRRRPQAGIVADPAAQVTRRSQAERMG